MKKVCLLMFLAVMMMTGCTKVKTNKLQGFWSDSPQHVESGYTYYGHEYYPSFNVRHNVIYFINSNTLTRSYSGTMDNSLAFEVQYSHNCSATPVPNHSGWYTGGNIITYTYVFEDNKVIVSDGSIYTYMDGKLYEDGSSTVLSPW